MSLTLDIAAFSMVLALCYSAYYYLKRKKLPDVNHLSYLGYGLFGVLVGISLLSLILLNSALPYLNTYAGTSFEVPSKIDIKDFAYALAVGGLMALIGGIEKIRHVFERKPE